VPLNLSRQRLVLQSLERLRPRRSRLDVIHRTPQSELSLMAGTLSVAFGVLGGAIARCGLKSLHF
jgi:hypothetical protein